jgi:hypothetical protein
MLGEIAATSSLMSCYKSTIVLGFFLYTLLLRYPQRKKLQALRSGDLEGHSIFPLHGIMQAGNVSLRTHTSLCSVGHCSIQLKPESMGLNTKYCNSGSRNVRSISV